jgi:hypothetical protein
LMEGASAALGGVVALMAASMAPALCRTGTRL